MINQEDRLDDWYYGSHKVNVNNKNWGYPKPKIDPYIPSPNTTYIPNIGNSGITDKFIEYNETGTLSPNDKIEVADTIPYGDTSTVIFDEDASTMPIDKDPHPIFESLMIEPYERTVTSNMVYV